MIKIIKREKGSEDTIINDQIDNNIVVNTDWSEILRQVYIEQTNARDMLIINTDAVNRANFGPEQDMLHLLIKYSD